MKVTHVFYKVTLRYGRDGCEWFAEPIAFRLDDLRTVNTSYQIVTQFSKRGWPLDEGAHEPTEDWSDADFEQWYEVLNAWYKEAQDGKHMDATRVYNDNPVVFGVPESTVELFGKVVDVENLVGVAYEGDQENSEPFVLEL